jgi:phage terminase Nu1 subunit (DNA packaging protein)
MYDLDRINAERERQGRHRLTREQAEQAVKQARDGGNADITAMLIIAAAATLASTESSAVPSFSSGGGDFSGGGASGGGDGGT